MLFLMSFTHYWVLVKILNVQLKVSSFSLSTDREKCWHNIFTELMYVCLYVCIYFLLLLFKYSLGSILVWMARTALQHDAHITHITVTDLVYNWFSICMLTSKISQSQQPERYIFASFPFISPTYHIFCCFINGFILDRSN